MGIVHQNKEILAVTSKIIQSILLMIINKVLLINFKLYKIKNKDH